MMQLVTTCGGGLRTAALITWVTTLAACSAPVPLPVAVRLGEDACAHCRMTLVSTATAAQIAEPGAEPVVFDELGCLQNYLAGTPVRDRAIVFVTDHRTGEWVRATEAVFTKTSVQTPMASGLLAHAGAASRDADPVARGGTPIAADAFALPARSARP